VSPEKSSYGKSSEHAKRDTPAGTTPPAAGGGAPGYEEDTKVQQATGGTPILQQSMDYYTVTDPSGDAIYPLADDTTYSNIDGTGARTTTYTYTWSPGTTTIDSDQNGPDTTDASIDIYNSNGQVVFTRDPRGFITYQAYDTATGALIKYAKRTLRLCLEPPAELARSYVSRWTYYSYYVDLQIATEGDAGRLSLGKSIPSDL
jgi:hypothetical protein